MTLRRVSAACAVVALFSSVALGSIIITTGTSAPTYGTTLTFDEPGGPTGQIPTDAFAISHGISEIQSGDGVVRIVDDPGNFGMPWAGGDNVYIAPWGAFLTYASPLAALSAQVWDDSGPATPFGGGLIIGVFNGDTELGVLVVDPAWGGIGNEWINITATDDTVFNRVVFLGNSWVGPTTMVDNLSWNVVPEPASALLLVSASLLFLRRR